MSARLYTVQTAIYASPWHGNPEDIDGFPDIDKLECFINPHGDLILTDREENNICRCHKDYLVRGMTGHYFIVPAEQFPAIYQAVEKLP